MRHVLSPGSGYGPARRHPKPRHDLRCALVCFVCIPESYLLLHLVRLKAFVAHGPAGANDDVPQPSGAPVSRQYACRLSAKATRMISSMQPMTEQRSNRLLAAHQVAMQPESSATNHKIQEATSLLPCKSGTLYCDPIQ